MNNGDNETVQWTLTDHLNTVRDIAKYDASNHMTAVVNQLLYDAFGRVTSESNPAVDSLFLFTARPFDSDTQLQNNLNRWYDPAVGRWLSEDPIGYKAGINLYEYVGDNPLIYVDPTGLQNPGQGFFPGPPPGQPHVPGIHPPQAPPRPAPAPSTISLYQEDGCCRPLTVGFIINRANQALAQPNCLAWFRDHGLEGTVRWNVRCHGRGKPMCWGFPAWTFPGAAIGLCENWLDSEGEVTFASLLIHELAHHYCGMGPGREECAISAQDACQIP